MLSVRPGLCKAHVFLLVLFPFAEIVLHGGNGQNRHECDTREREGGTQPSRGFSHFLRAHVISTARPRTSLDPEKKFRPQSTPAKRRGTRSLPTTRLAALVETSRSSDLPAGCS